MSFSDETLAAYADGELDPAAREEIEEAARRDPCIEQRIGRYRALRARLQSTYAAELAEPVPDRLLAALRNPVPVPASHTSPTVADLEAVRATKARASPRITATATRSRYALAASVIVAVGVGVGFLAWRHDRPWVQAGNGTLVAQGTLADGLSHRLSGEPAPGSSLRIGLSFVAKSGDYCRSFSLAEDAGIACRHAGQWKIVAMAKQRAAAASGSQFRTASSTFPEKLLEAIEAQMAGEPLDRAGEIAARDNQWTKPPPSR